MLLIILKGAGAGCSKFLSLAGKQYGLHLSGSQDKWNKWEVIDDGKEPDIVGIKKRPVGSHEAAVVWGKDHGCTCSQ